MHIKTLRAQNFRCFQDLQISFQPGFNLLIGNNMSGKTAVLDALRSCLNGYVKEFVTSDVGVELKDVRLKISRIGDTTNMVPAGPCEVRGAVELSAGLVNFFSSIGNRIFDDKTATSLGYLAEPVGDMLACREPGGIWNLARSIFNNFSSERIFVPVVAFHGTNRVSETIKSAGAETAPLPKNKGRAYAYELCLSHKSSLPIQRRWIMDRTMSEVQRRLRKLPLLEDGPLLGIEKAILTCLPEAKQFYFDFASEFQDLTVVFQDDRRLPWTMLSDGMRSVISLALDIAWRAVVLNPQLGAKAPEQATGIVLIDELDLALHPVWQRRIVGDLSRAFPNIQFIATTHSPQIIGSAPSALVQVIDGDHVSAVQRPFGLDSNTLLTEVMGGAERDPAIVALFDEVNQLMNEKKWDEARQKLAVVSEQMDRQDTELVRLRARIDFLSRAAVRN